MTRAASVTRSAASLLTSRLLVAVIALVFLGVSTRLLTLQEMAVFAVYNTLCGLLTVVCSFGLLATCIKVLPGMLAAGSNSPERAEATRLLRLSVLVYVLGAAAVAGSLWVAAEPISRLLLKTPDRAADVRAATLTAFCYGLYEASQLLLSALQRFGRVGSYNVAAALTQRLLSLLLFFTFGLKGYFAGFALGSLFGAGLGFGTLLPLLRGARSVHGKRQKGGRGGQGGHATGRTPAGWIAWSLPFYVDGYLRYLYMHADQLLVGIFLSPSDLSIYFVAKRSIQYCQVLVSSFIDPLGTKVAELRGSDPAAVARAFTTTLRYFILLFVPFAALLACMSPFLLLLIGGARYGSAAVPLALLFLSLPFYVIFSHLSTFSYALGQPRERLLSDLVSALAQTGAIVALMPALALTGLALARAVGFGVAALFTWRRVIRYLPGIGKVGTRGTRMESGALRAFVQCAGPTALMAVMILGPHRLIGRPGLMPLYALPAMAACLIACLVMVLTPADRDALSAMMTGRGRAARAARRVIAIGTNAPAESDSLHP